MCLSKVWDCVAVQEAVQRTGTKDERELQGRKMGRRVALTWRIQRSLD